MIKINHKELESNFDEIKDLWDLNWCNNFIKSNIIDHFIQLITDSQNRFKQIINKNNEHNNNKKNKNKNKNQNNNNHHYKEEESMFQVLELLSQIIFIIINSNPNLFETKLIKLTKSTKKQIDHKIELYTKFIRTIFKFVKNISNYSEKLKLPELITKQIGNFSALILKVCSIFIEYKPELVQNLNFNLNKWIKIVLIFNQSQFVRKASVDFLYHLSKNYLTKYLELKKHKSTNEDEKENGLTKFKLIIGELRDFLPEVENHRRTIGEYFDLLVKLLELAEEYNLGNVLETDPTELIDKVIKLLKSHPIVEKNNLPKSMDYSLSGLLKLGSYLLLKLEKNENFKETLNEKYNLLNEIFNIFLYANKVPQNHPLFNQLPKCKTFITRAAGFEFLQSLTLNSEGNYKKLTLLLIDQLKELQLKTDNWNYGPFDKKANSSENISGYVGLRNQGATCYLNSVMQQLFKTPELREGILNFNLRDKVIKRLQDKQNSDNDDNGNKNEKGNSDGNNAKSLDPNKIDLKNLEENYSENELVLHQLQKMFVYLKESKMRSYNTLPFCRAIKEPNGNPINTREQKDANEFLNILFDKIEDSLKNTQSANLLKNIYGGHLIHQIICQSQISHRSEREEPFFTVSLEVKNKKTLTESLEMFIQGDMLNNNNQYHCSQCNTKVDALKRCCFFDLPNTLIFHLKRFDFDFDLLQNVKINSMLGFPHELNMRPYTLEGIIDKENGINYEEEQAQRENELNGDEMEKDGEEKDNDEENNGINNEKDSDDKEKDKNDGDNDDDDENDDNVLGESENGDDEKEKDKSDGNISEESKNGDDDNKDKNEKNKKNNNENEKSQIEDQTDPYKINRLRKQSYYDYELVGVVVHSGTANFGHYYSYIKDRQIQKNGDNKNENEDNYKLESVWHTYNDSSVSKFDVDNLPKAAFGSVEKSVDDPRGQSRRYNGYMLLYERKKKIIIETGNNVNESETTNTTNVNNENKIKKESDKNEKINSEINDVIQEIKTQNKNVQHEKNIYSVSYFNWIKSHIDQILTYQNNNNNNNNNQKNEKQIIIRELTDQSIYPLILRSATLFCMKVLTHTSNKDDFGLWIDPLKALYSKCPEEVQWLLTKLLDNNSLWAITMIYNCYSSTVKRNFIGFIKHLMDLQAKIDRNSYLDTMKIEILTENKSQEKDQNNNQENGKENSNTEKQTKEILLPKSILLRFVNVVLNNLNKCIGVGKDPSTPLQILIDFINLGSFELNYLIVNNTLENIINFYQRTIISFLNNQNNKSSNGSERRTGTSSTYHSIYSSTYSSKARNKISANKFNLMVKFIYLLIKGCEIEYDNSNQYNNETLDQRPKLKINRILSFGTFFEHIVENQVNPKYTRKLIQLLSHDRLDVSKVFIQLFLTTLGKLHEKNFNPIHILHVFGWLCNIEDEFTKQRIQLSLMPIMEVVSSLLESHRRVSAQKIIRALWQIKKNSSQITLWIMSNFDYIDKIAVKTGLKIKLKNQNDENVEGKNDEEDEKKMKRKMTKRIQSQKTRDRRKKKMQMEKRRRKRKKRKTKRETKGKRKRKE